MFALSSKTINPAISLNTRMAELVSEETINPGDSISYVSDDTGERITGVYMTLWAYLTDGRESSPFVGDSRHMAKVYTAQGGIDYADIRTIRKSLKS